jgi:hypothetical protein
MIKVKYRKQIMEASGFCLSCQRGLPLTGSGGGGSIYKFERCALAKFVAFSKTHPPSIRAGSNKLNFITLVLLKIAAVASAVKNHPLANLFI